jgi:monofunctional biosynthetic peptidoglycan transglycosylase
MARKPRRFRGRLFRWLLLAGSVATILSVLLILPLRWSDPPTTAFMLRDRMAGAQIEQRWLPLAQLGDALPIAVVASEDQKFPTHHGFDLQSMQEALADGAGRGASTISQQTIKNLFLWPGRSWVRKAIEAWLTVVMEALLPKRRILEIYLNIAQFGPGLYGVAAATEHYFGRPPDRISLAEAARLATVLPSPSKIDPRHQSEHVDRRAAWILDQVRGLGGAAYLDRLD